LTVIPDRNTFESAYAGQAPWDIGRPQMALIDVPDQITGSILDACLMVDDNGKNIHITETISACDVNPKLDPNLYELPK
jgi:hypothetical protein